MNENNRPRLPDSAVAGHQAAACPHPPIENALSHLGRDLATLLRGYQPPATVPTAWVDDEYRLPPLDTATATNWPTCEAARVHAQLQTYTDRLRSIVRITRAVDAVAITPDALTDLGRRYSHAPDRLHDEVEEHIDQQRRHAAEQVGYDTALQACLSTGNVVIDTRTGPDGFPRFRIARSGLLDPRTNTTAVRVLHLGRLLDRVLAHYARTDPLRRHRALGLLLAAGYTPLPPP